MADDQAPDQVQPRGAEHGPECEQYAERETLAEAFNRVWTAAFRAERDYLFHALSNRQKETKP